jgi:hypothetical protein
MNRTERLTSALHLATGAKAISIIFVVGIIALLFAHTPMRSAEEAMAPMAVAGEPSNPGIGALASTQPRQEAIVAGAAKQAADADAKVPAKPVFLPTRLKSQALAPVPIYLQPDFKSNAPTAEPIATF